jgi:hypothetical protein
LGSAIGFAVLQVIKATWWFVAARRIFQWRGRVAWPTVGTIVAVLVLGTASLTSRNEWLRLALGVLFVGLFFVLHFRTLNEYLARLIAEFRLYVARKEMPVESLMKDEM